MALTAVEVGGMLPQENPWAEKQQSNSSSMTMSMCGPLSLSHVDCCWGEFSLIGIKDEIKPLKKYAVPGDPERIPSYLWAKGDQCPDENWTDQGMEQTLFPSYAGYAEARDLIGGGAVEELRRLSVKAQGFLVDIFEDITNAHKHSSCNAEAQHMSSSSSKHSLVRLRLSPDLSRWRESQHAMGRILPPKGTGLRQTSSAILEKLGTSDWPAPQRTTNALFGCGIASLLIGASDKPTLFSNYVIDMAFYYEHGYNHVFPDLEPLLQKGLTDPHALGTRGGRERREAVRVGQQYIQSKILLEKKHKPCLGNISAKLDRRTAQILALSESSLLGMAAEAIAQGFDPAAVMSDLVFSSPGTDVVDVGSDLLNSEVMNSFLNVTDITSTGIVDEPTLRKIYDAYAATGARMLTQRWHEPVARMCAALYTWHMTNDRHMFLRRAILGRKKVMQEKLARPQREADFDEVFDEEYRLTGFSRPLDPRYTCDGEETCDHVQRFLDCCGEEDEQDGRLLRELWWFLVVEPLEYVRGGRIDEQREEELSEGLRMAMAEVYISGHVLGMVWLIAHANHHAWQINHLFEAAMFGSILDGGALGGKLDRVEED